MSGVYVVLHRLGYSSLVPRPQHPKADLAAQEEFKKTLREMVRSVARTHPGAEIQIWVQDEARFGQKGSLTRVWARRGSRPRAPKQTQYESLYLTGAVCPATGAAAAIITPTLNAGVINLFFAELKTQIPDGVHVILIMDHAGTTSVTNSASPRTSRCSTCRLTRRS